MMGIVIGSLPNIACLRIDNTKNSDNLDLNKNSRIELVLLQGIHICDKNWHAIPKSQATKNSNA